MYHRISDVAPEPNWLAVSPENFTHHLEYILHAYHPIRLLDLVNSIRSRSIPDKAVAITFDDGYYDNFITALPLLETARMPATVFVTTGFIGSLSEFWWDELSRIILDSQKLPSILSMSIRGSMYEWMTTNTEQRQYAYSELKEIIKPLPASVKNDIMEYLADWSGTRRTLREDYRTMTMDELKRLASSEYIDVGAHTITHPLLTTLTSTAQYDEIVNSRQSLENILNQDVLTFAYPNGDFSNETVEIVKEAGFVTALTTKTGNITSGDDLFRLRRCGVNDWEMSDFKQNLDAFFRTNN